MNKEKLSIILQRIVFVILAICSFEIVIFTIKNIIENCKWDKWMLSSVLVLTCFLVLFMVVICQFKQIKKECIPIMIALLSLGVHFLIILLMGENTIQSSDLRYAIDQSAGWLDKDCQWYLSVTSWSIVPIYYKLLRIIVNTLWGIEDIVLVGIYLNAIYSTLTALNIYFSILLCGKSRRLGFIASTVFTLWPMHVIYSICPTPEFVNIWLVSLAAVLFCYGVKQFKIKK